MIGCKDGDQHIATWICSAAQKAALHMADRKKRDYGVEIWNSKVEMMRRIISRNRIPYAVAFVNTVLGKMSKKENGPYKILTISTGSIPRDSVHKILHDCTGAGAPCLSPKEGGRRQAVG